MKKVMRFLVVAMSTFMTSCGGDDELKPEKFATQEEAMTAFSNNQYNMQDAYHSVGDAIDYTGGVSVGAVKTEKKKKTNRAMTWAYDASTGWWSDANQYSGEGYNESYEWKIRYSPRDANGQPTETTDKMEYKYDVDLESGTSGNMLELSTDQDITLTNIDEFNAETGNLIINGSNNLSWKMAYAYELYSYSYEYVHKYKYNSIAASPTDSYPQSGSVSFTIKSNFEGDGVEGDPEALNYYIEAKITFDGDNTAILEFGGYSFTLNLDSFSITPI
ncbi:hypothetical protein L6Q79_11425 [bacterium]|nr:hypothetical protein [bacterium]NUN46903.1 hypothetical protein [bacterium]